MATVTVNEAPGNVADWVGLYTSGAADGAYLSWSYLNGSAAPPTTGLISATLNFTLPVAAGAYEFRFFENNSYNRLATSGAVEVLASTAQLTVNGVAPPTAVTVVAGASLTVNVTGGPANAADWLGLFASSAEDSAEIDWRYLNGTTVPPSIGVGSGTVVFQAPVTPGDYEFRFFANNGYGRLATSSIVIVVVSSAQIAVNGASLPTVVSISAGAASVVDVTNDPGNAQDWIGLYAAGAPDSGYVQWKYLNGSTSPPASGVTSATLTFGMPANAGSYEFRLFANGSFARLATSTNVVISASASQLVVNGVAPPEPVTAQAGSIALVSASDGPGNATDWVALYATGAADSAFIDYRYLNDTAVAPESGVPAATLHFLAPPTAGTYEFRFFASNGYGLLATSSPVMVPAPTSQIAVNGTLPPTPVSVAPGATVSVVVSGGPGNVTDWVAFASPSAPDTSYLAWQYLNGTTAPPQTGLPGATLSFDLPNTQGEYELRFFANNSFTRLATSTVISSVASPPSVDIWLTAPFYGTTFVSPPAIGLEAVATVTNGSIDHVEFRAGSTVLGNASSAPYQIAWPSPVPGTYTLTAVAIDNLGRTTASPPVIISITDTGSGYGTLGAPIATPTGGFYIDPPTVTLFAASDATIRYTTDGSTPTLVSTAYLSPVPLAGSTTLKAIAVQEGWTTSDVMVQTYSIDNIPPTVTVTLSPLPNSAGWNNTPVTIAFACSDAKSGIESCPTPVVIDTEGAGQTVIKTVHDLAGNEASVSVMVNIDKTAPAVSVTGLTEGEIVTSSSLVLSATADDNFSGVLDANCNGEPVSVSGITVDCTVSLGKGLNSLVVEVRDRAGNTASASVRVLRAGDAGALSVMPSRYVLAAGETVRLNAVDDYGRSPASLEWSSSDTDVATVDAEGVVTAVSPGDVTITTEAQGQPPLVAAATIVVSPPGPLEVGMEKWSIDPLPGYWSNGTVAVAPAGTDSTAFVSVESDGTNTAIRGLSMLGQQTYLAAAPVAPGETAFPIMGAANGGVLLSIVSSDPGRTALVRFSTENGGSSWRYTDPSLTPMAQAPDGTIYGVAIDGLDRSLVSIDGSSGSRRSLITLPRSNVVAYTGVDYNCEVANVQHYDYPALVAGGKVGFDGTAYFVVFYFNQTTKETGCPETNTYERTQRVLLFRMTAGGGFAQVLREYGWPGETDPYWGDTLYSGANFSLLPDDQGGILAHWPECRNAVGGPPECATQAVYVSGGSQLGTQYALPVTPAISASGRVAYGLGTDGFARKFDMRDGAVIWTRAASASPVAALAGGSVLLDGAIVDGTGSATVTGLPGFAPSVTVDNLWLSGMSATVGIPVWLDLAAGFPVQQGNAALNNAPARRYGLDELEQAAIDLLNWTWTDTVQLRWEFGGMICQRDSVGFQNLWTPA